VLRIPHTSIAVTQKEVAGKIGADNARLLPSSLQRSPVGFTTEAGDDKIAISKGKGERGREAAESLLDGV
jgi:hypothetical protein